MNWIFKNKKILSEKSIKGPLTALFLIAFFFSIVTFFLKPKLVLATTCIVAQDCINVGEKVNTACNNGTCVAPSITSSSAGSIAKPEIKTSTQLVTQQQDKSLWDKLIGDPFFLTIRWILFSFLQLIGFVFGIVGTIFQWAVDPVNISGAGGLLNKQTIRDVWVMVRDTLNMTFIMILLFSAFCTVFQVDSWSLKKVWLNILINALLVNFSFPIARLFIDVSNVAMYYFLNHLFSGTGQGSGSAIMASFGDISNLAGTLLPNGYADAEIAYLLAAISFSFILGATLMVLAALFVVRLVALCMIVMFSPVGFVGFIFPAASKYASQWWDNLFKYAFFGPVMVFMMMVSMQIMRAMGSENMSAFKSAANMNASGGQANWIASSAFFLIPVMILWMAMGIANSMNIALSKEIVGKAEKVAKWAGMKASGANFALGTYKAYKARREQAKGEQLANRFGKHLGSQQDRLRASLEGVPIIGGRGAKQAKQRYQSDAATEVAASGKLHDVANMTEVDLAKLKNSKDKYERAAAILELANRGKADVLDLDMMRKEFGDNSIAFNQLRNKIKTFDPTVAFAKAIDPATGTRSLDTQRLEEHLKSNQFDAKKLNANALGNATFLEMAMDKDLGNMKPEDLNDLAKKSDRHSDNIKSSLGAIVAQTRHANTADETNKNLHLSYMASTGTVHSTLNNPVLRAEIFKKLDKDNAKNLSAATISSSGSEIMEHINIGKFKEVVTNLKSDASKQAFVDAVQGMNPTDPRRIAFKAQIQNDPVLRGMWPGGTP